MHGDDAVGHDLPLHLPLIHVRVSFVVLLDGLVQVARSILELSPGPRKRVIITVWLHIIIIRLVSVFEYFEVKNKDCQNGHSGKLGVHRYEDDYAEQ